MSGRAGTRGKSRPQHSASSLNEKEIKELKSKIAETKARLKNERKERIEMEEKVKYIELKIRRLKNFGVEEIVENVS